MDWGHLERQLAALGEAVAEGARHTAADAERAQRSLDRLESLQRLLAAGAWERDGSPAQGVAGAPAEVEGGAPARGQRASLHQSALADLFRDTQRTRRPG